MQKAPAFRKDADYGSIHPIEDELAFEQNGWFYNIQHQPVRPSGTVPPPPARKVVAEEAPASIDELADEGADDIGVEGVAKADPIADVNKSTLAAWFNGGKVPFFTVRSAIKKLLDVNVTGADEARALLSEKYGW